MQERQSPSARKPPSARTFWSWPPRTLEQEGLPLPEAQVDRFAEVVSVPHQDEERQIVRANLRNRGAQATEGREPARHCGGAQAVRSIYMDEKIERYIDLVFATRNPEDAGWAI